MMGLVAWIAMAAGSIRSRSRHLAVCVKVGMSQKATALGVMDVLQGNMLQLLLITAVFALTVAGVPQMR